MPRAHHRRGVASAIALVAATTIVLTGCSSAGHPSSKTTSSGSATVTLSIVPDPTGASDFYRQQMNACEAKYPGLTVNIVENPADQQLNAVELAFQQGDGPDVFQAQGAAALDRFYNEGRVASLNKYVNKDFTKLFPGIDNPSTSGLYLDNKLVSLPLTWGGYSYVSVFLYNKTILAKSGFTSPPKTWSDVETMATKITADGGGSVFGFAPTQTGAAGIDYMAPTGVPSSIATNGLNLKTGKADVANPEYVKLVNMFTDMQAKGVMEPGWESWDGSKAFQEFSAGRLAMYASAPWHIAQIRMLAPKLKLGIAAIPVPSDGRKAYAGESSTYSPQWSMSSKTKHPKQAWEVMSCLGSSAFQGAYFKKFGTLTAIPSSWANDLTPDQAKIVKIAKDTERVVPNPALLSKGGAAIVAALASQTGLDPLTAASQAIIQNKPFGPIAKSLDKQIDAAVSQVKGASKKDITFANWNPTKSWSGK